jgi:hypothetical protein
VTQFTHTSKSRNTDDIAHYSHATVSATSSLIALPNVELLSSRKRLSSEIAFLDRFSPFSGGVEFFLAVMKNATVCGFALSQIPKRESESDRIRYAGCFPIE